MYCQFFEGLFGVLKIIVQSKDVAGHARTKLRKSLLAAWTELSDEVQDMFLLRLAGRPLVFFALRLCVQAARLVNWFKKRVLHKFEISRWFYLN